MRLNCAKLVVSLVALGSAPVLGHLGPDDLLAQMKNMTSNLEDLQSTAAEITEINAALFLLRQGPLFEVNKGLQEIVDTETRMASQLASGGVAHSTPTTTDNNKRPKVVGRGTRENILTHPKMHKGKKNDDTGAIIPVPSHADVNADAVSAAVSNAWTVFVDAHARLTDIVADKAGIVQAAARGVTAAMAGTLREDREGVQILVLSMARITGKNWKSVEEYGEYLEDKIMVAVQKYEA